MEDSPFIPLSTTYLHFCFRSHSLFLSQKPHLVVSSPLSSGSFPLTFKHFHISNMFKTKRSPEVCPLTLAHFKITTLFHFFPLLEQVVYTLLHFHTLLILLHSGLVHPQPPWNFFCKLLCMLLMSLGFHDILLLVFFLLCLFHSLFYGISLSLCCWSLFEFCPRSSSLLTPHTFPGMISYQISKSPIHISLLIFIFINLEYIYFDIPHIT